MKRLLFVAAALAVAAAGPASVPHAEKANGPEWSMNATIIEACSCPMFCPCYFNTKPAGHAGHGGHGEMKHFCKFNMGFKVNEGHHLKVKLDGVKFWITGDLGGDYSEGNMEWAKLTFDKSMTQEQRDALLKIVPNIYPVTWGSFETAEGEVTWKASKNEAHALLDGGKTAEVKLASTSGAMSPGEPVVIDNLRYWGTTSNDGFVLMPNVVEAYRVSDKAFEYKGTNGFMITFDIDSESTGKGM